MQELSKIEIHTDGACRGNPGPGGWGAYLRYNNIEKQIYGKENNTTNNRMELTAVINALKLLKKPCYIELFTDSMYVHDGITRWVKNWQKNGWKTANKKTVKNVELWQELVKQATIHKIEWKWVKGHNGNHGNEIADMLANKAIDKLI
jgi:ribonuclease HI